MLYKTQHLQVFIFYYAKICLKYLYKITKLHLIMLRYLISDIYYNLKYIYKKCKQNISFM